MVSWCVTGKYSTFNSYVTTCKSIRFIHKTDNIIYINSIVLYIKELLNLAIAFYLDLYDKHKLSYLYPYPSRLLIDFKNLFEL